MESVLPLVREQQRSTMSQQEADTNDTTSSASQNQTVEGSELIRHIHLGENDVLLGRGT